MPPVKPAKPVIRDAVAADLNAVNDIAIRSKAYWNYTDEMMAQFRDELTLSEIKLTDTSHLGVAVASETDTAVGFYSVDRKLGQPDGELDGLFLLPDYIGTGLGRLLMQQACRIASDWRLQGLIIQSDPNAEAFYLAMGAVNIGSRRSGSIASRQLPLLRLDLKNNSVFK